MGQVLTVRSRISDQLLFIQALGVIQCLLGSKAEDLIRFTLKRCQVKQPRRILHKAFGLNPRNSSILSITPGAQRVSVRLLGEVL